MRTKTCTCILYGHLVVPIVLFIKTSIILFLFSFFLSPKCASSSFISEWWTSPVKTDLLTKTSEVWGEKREKAWETQPAAGRTFQSKGCSTHEANVAQKNNATDFLFIYLFYEKNWRVHGLDTGVSLKTLLYCSNPDYQTCSGYLSFMKRL